MSLIAAEGLTVGHGRRPVAAGIDLSVGAGEILCLLGPNGAGKTTLFRTLLGLQPPLAGRALLGGEDVGALPRAEIARRVAYVPQSLAAPFAFTLIDLVLMGRTVRLGPFARPRPADEAAARAALEAVGLGSLTEAEATRVSGGQRQLALIARALAQEAGAIVMDEPTASLDFGNRLRLLERLRAMAARGLGLVVSTHEPDHALSVATRVAVIAEGRMIACGPPRATLTPALLSRVYGVAVAVRDGHVGAAG